MKKLEFNIYQSPKGGEKLQIINSDTDMVEAILDREDVENLKNAGLNINNNNDVLIYCNQYKGTQFDGAEKYNIIHTQEAK